MKISACLIYGPDESPAAAIAGIKPHVDEVIAVKSTDVPGAHDERGRIVDFAKARQASFDLATGDWIVWLDADDLIAGGDRLRSILETAPADTRVLFPYEYAYDSDGACVSLQYRERAVRRADGFRWQYPVHEVLVRHGITNHVLDNRVVWKHQRKESKSSAGRNLRILREYVREHGADEWALYNLGQECLAIGQREECREYLERYVEVSKWPEQVALALVRLSELAIARGDYAVATTRAWAAVEAFPSLETRYALARAQYVSVILTGNGSMVDVADEATTALDWPRTTHLLPVDPQTHRYTTDLLVSASVILGQPERAVEAIDAELARKDSPALRLQRRELLVNKARADIDKAVTALASLYERVDINYPIVHTDVIIACGPTAEYWDPSTAERHGIGGSETAVIEMAKRLVERGCRVRVHAVIATPGIYDGVEYLPLEALTFQTECDVLVAWRHAALLESATAKIRILWVHDVAPHEATSERIARADVVFALSQWHRDDLVEQGIPSAKIRITRNGIDLARFDQTVERNPHKAIYSSSPDRGLETLLGMWPAIRAQVPDAELHCFYGFAPTLKPEFVERITAKAEALQDQGVVLRGRVNQKTLAWEMLSAGAWLYPTAFTETSCIGAMEAQAAGLAVVHTGIAALAETAEPFGHWTDLECFARCAIVALLRDDLHPRAKIMAHAREHFAWDPVADEWRAMFDDLLGEHDAYALPAYEPVETYLKEAAE